MTPSTDINEQLRNALRGVVADVGSGPGSAIDPESRLRPAALEPRLLVHVDLEPTILTGGHLVCANLEHGHLPFARRSIDVVVCMHVLEHLNDPETLVAQIAQTLRPGGFTSTAPTAYMMPGTRSGPPSSGAARMRCSRRHCWGMRASGARSATCTPPGVTWLRWWRNCGTEGLLCGIFFQRPRRVAAVCRC